jgi:hypothetical protein
MALIAGPEDLDFASSGEQHERGGDDEWRAVVEQGDGAIEVLAIPIADTGRIWSRCLNEINYLKNRKNSLVREGYEAERRSRSDEALYAITTIRRSLSRYRMAVRASLGESHPALRYLKPSIDDQAAVKEAHLEKTLADQTDLRPIDGERASRPRFAPARRSAVRRLLGRRRLP